MRYINFGLIVVVGLPAFMGIVYGAGMVPLPILAVSAAVLAFVVMMAAVVFTSRSAEIRDELKGLRKEMARLAEVLERGSKPPGKP